MKLVDLLPERVHLSTLTRGRGYKKIIMLNSAEHEVLNDYKYKNIKKFSFFPAHVSVQYYFPAHKC